MKSPPSIEVKANPIFIDAYGAPLGPAQLQRIEAVHRGFFYQHLYAVACLLTCGRQPRALAIVEPDEDVEFASTGSQNYAQVKTRSRPLQLCCAK